MNRERPSGGWSFCVFKGLPETEKDSRFSSFGPVVTDPRDRRWAGADKHTNNVSELCAAIELLTWLISQGEAELNDQVIPSGQPVVIRLDSTYTINAMLQNSRSTTNVAMREVLVHLWKIARTTRPLSVVHVHAHKGHVGNELADTLAKRGTNPEFSHLWSQRAALVSDWSKWSVPQDMQAEPQVQFMQGISNDNGLEIPPYLL